MSARPPRIVLVRPFFPENVGAIARSMRHAGATELVLVGGVDPRHPNARKLAKAAEPILEAARVVETLDEALEGIAWTCAATAHRDAKRLPFTARTAGRRHREEAGATAFVFGNEKNGLPWELVDRCDAILTIPSLAPGESFNLAQAATLALYEACLAEDEPPSAPATPATEGLRRQIDALMSRFGGLKAHQGTHRGTWHRLLGRLALTPEEAALLTTVVSRLNRALGLQDEAPTDESGGTKVTAPGSDAARR